MLSLVFEAELSKTVALETYRTAPKADKTTDRSIQNIERTRSTPFISIISIGIPDYPTQVNFCWLTPLIQKYA